MAALEVHSHEPRNARDRHDGNGRRGRRAVFRSRPMHGSASGACRRRRSAPSPSGIGDDFRRCRQSDPEPSCRRRWMGGHRDLGRDGAGSSIVLSAESISNSPNQSDSSLDISETRPRRHTRRMGRSNLSRSPAATDARQDDVGVYDWSLSPSGRMLTITAERGRLQRPRRRRRRRAGGGWAARPPTTTASGCSMRGRTNRNSSALVSIQAPPGGQRSAA